MLLKIRLLKIGRRLTLGIGDNREHCFYVPVGFQLIRLYLNNGFELEELVSILVCGGRNHASVCYLRSNRLIIRLSNVNVTALLLA